MVGRYFAPSVNVLDGVMRPMNPLLSEPPDAPTVDIDSGYSVSPNQYRQRLNGGLQDVASAFQLMDMFLFRG